MSSGLFHTDCFLLAPDLKDKGNKRDCCTKCTIVKKTLNLRYFLIELATLRGIKVLNSSLKTAAQRDDEARVPRQVYNGDSQ